MGPVRAFALPAAYGCCFSQCIARARVPPRVGNQVEHAAASVVLEAVPLAGARAGDSNGERAVVAVSELALGGERLDRGPEEFELSRIEAAVVEKTLPDDSRDIARIFCRTSVSGCRPWRRSRCCGTRRSRSNSAKPTL